MTNYPATERAVHQWNTELKKLHESGDPLVLNVPGIIVPSLKIKSFDPLEVETYGKLRNRAPEITGSLALRGFLTQPHPDGSTILIAGLESDQGSYAIYVDGNSPATAPFLQNIGEQLGKPIDTVE